MPPVDRVFIVNLVRRRDRAFQLRPMLKTAGFKAPVEWFRAVDGLELNDSILSVYGVKLYTDWKNADARTVFHNRDLTVGELGCALSHWILWRRIDDDAYQTTLILEDDAALPPGIGPLIDDHLLELDRLMPDWDLCYVGRKRVLTPPYCKDPPEPEVHLSERFVIPAHSWCTHAYVVSQKGARRLLEQRLDQFLIPVDEMLPALYSWHPRPDVRAYFGDGDRLKVAAIDPNLSDQFDDISDTERSAELQWSGG